MQIKSAVEIIVDIIIAQLPPFCRELLETSTFPAVILTKVTYIYKSYQKT